MFATFFFYFFSVVAVISATYVILTRHPTYGVLSLAVSMFSLAALFVMLEAHFIAMIQILIYAGAILVLFLFILMLLGPQNTVSSASIKQRFLWCLLVACLAVAFLWQIVWVIKGVGDPNFPLSTMIGSIEVIGRAMFTQHLLAFEIISLILLVGVLGVVNLTRREGDSRHA